MNTIFGKNGDEPFPRYDAAFFENGFGNQQDWRRNCGLLNWFH